MGVRNSDELRKAHDTFQPAMVELYSTLRQSQPVFNALESLKTGNQWDQIGSIRQRLVQKELTSMRLAGLSLKGENKTRFNAIQKELADLSTQFFNAVLDSRKAYGLVLRDASDIAGFQRTP